ncbi:hypothetical protein MWU49_14515 [Alcanivorax sp. S6407]|nr:hypothetical protein [Alcanivorax sp. S6407]MCK0154926.1 hypothetical protein [Alcanivorax sp. S6407]
MFENLLERLNEVEICFRDGRGILRFRPGEEQADQKVEDGDADDEE